MKSHISFQANSETRGTASIQSFEADGSEPPAGTKATARPSDRPREVPLISAPPPALQLFECEQASEAPRTKATPRPPGRERAGSGPSISPSVPLPSQIGPGATEPGGAAQASAA